MEVQNQTQSHEIEEVKARQIEALFSPMLKKASEYEIEANDIFSRSNEITKELSLEARELRLKLQKLRTITSNVHKEQKDFYLKAGRFIDGFKNTQIAACSGLEERLKQIEDHEKIQEQKRLESVQLQRSMELKEYGVENPPSNLAEMDPDIWSKYLEGTKIDFQRKKEAEEQAKKEAEEREIKAKLFQDRRYELAKFQCTWTGLTYETTEEEYLKVLNGAKEDLKKYNEEQEKIKKEKQALEKQLEEERKQAEEERKKQEEAKAKQEAEAKALREKEEAERKKKEEEDRKEKQALEDKLEAERKELERIRSLKADLNINEIVSKLEKYLEGTEHSDSFEYGYKTCIKNLIKIFPK